MIHMPMPLSLTEGDVSADISPGSDNASKAAQAATQGLWRRPPDTAALLAADGSLLLNGYRVMDVEPRLLPAIRYCLGVYTGAAGKPFFLMDVPVEASVAGEALQLLKKYRGVELYEPVLS